MKKDYLITLLFLILLAGFTTSDIISDINEGLSFRHWFHELLIVLGSAGLILYKLILSIRKDGLLVKYKGQVHQANIEIDYYKKKVQEINHDFTEIIDNQFRLWGLSPSEKDIALLVIKGLSMKDIADLRGSSEATVRQQAANVYKKSNLDNRLQLAAYFLEDLFSA